MTPSCSSRSWLNRSHSSPVSDGPARSCRQGQAHPQGKPVAASRRRRATPLAALPWKTGQRPRIDMRSPQRRIAIEQRGNRCTKSRAMIATIPPSSRHPPPHGIYAVEAVEQDRQCVLQSAHAGHAPRFRTAARRCIRRSCRAWSSHVPAVRFQGLCQGPLPPHLFAPRWRRASVVMLGPTPSSAQLCPETARDDHGISRASSARATL